MEVSGHAMVDLLDALHSTAGCPPAEQPIRELIDVFQDPRPQQPLTPCSLSLLIASRQWKDIEDTFLSTSAWRDHWREPPCNSCLQLLFCPSKQSNTLLLRELVAQASVPWNEVLEPMLVEKSSKCFAEPAVSALLWDILQHHALPATTALEPWQLLTLLALSTRNASNDSAVISYIGSAYACFARTSAALYLPPSKAGHGSAHRLRAELLALFFEYLRLCCVSKDEMSLLASQEPDNVASQPTKRQRVQATELLPPTATAPIRASVLLSGLREALTSASIGFGAKLSSALCVRLWQVVLLAFQGSHPKSTYGLELLR